MKEKFKDLSVEEGAQLLLEIIRECSEGSKNRNGSDDNITRGRNLNSISEEDEEGGNNAWQMPLGTCVEIAVIDLSQRQMRRLRQPLFSQLSTS